MARGARTTQTRPQTEWKGGVARQKIYEAERRIEAQSKPEPTPTPLWPHLSVIRFPKVKNCPSAYPWHEALDDLGVKNRSVGTARSLGSSAISLMTGREINAMLQDKYPDDAAKQNSMTRLQRRVGDGITQFLMREFQSGLDATTQAAFDEHIAEREMVEDYDHRDRFVWPPSDSSDIVLLPVEERATREHKFGQSTFVVPRKDALQPFGRGYGVDLSAVDQLYQERDDLARYMRREWNLDTGLLDPARRPHASVFDFHDHIKYAEIHHEVRMPLEITFSAPVVLNS